VRIEARDESSKHEPKTTTKAKTPRRKNKCKDKNLDNSSRLIEASEGGFFDFLHSLSG
jgi:hypothetical protein